MTIFGTYSDYYDLIYQGKNYKSEAEYIDSIIQSFQIGGNTLLELGCGTGRYSHALTQRGYLVHGVDLSLGMLEIARNVTSDHVSFSHGDARTLRLGRHFDVVVALFHVMSYQTANQDVIDMLGTIKEHLSPNGIAIFDFWYGPAVLTQKPSVRLKEVEGERVRIWRVANPEVHYDKNVVDVNYTIFIEDKGLKSINRFEETHKMRYFFDPELTDFYASLGMHLLRREEWLTGREPSDVSWGVLHVLGHADGPFA